MPVLLLTSFMCHCSDVMFVPTAQICDFAVEYASLASQLGKQLIFTE